MRGLCIKMYMYIVLFLAGLPGVLRRAAYKENPDRCLDYNQTI